MLRIRRVKVISLNGFYYTDRREAQTMLQNGEAERINGNPRIIRILETPIFDEEQRYLRGYTVPRATRGGTGASKPVQTSRGIKFSKEKKANQDQRGKFNTGGGVRCRPPRLELEEAERDFRRYKNAWLTKHGHEGEEAAKEAMSKRRGYR